MKRMVTALILWGLVVSAVLAGCLSQKGKAPSYVLRYAENQPLDYPTTQGGIYFAQLVEERTNGDVKILVHYDEELGDETSVLQQVRFGGIDFARVSLSQVVTYSEKHAVLNYRICTTTTHISGPY